MKVESTKAVSESSAVTIDEDHSGCTSNEQVKPLELDM